MHRLSLDGDEMSNNKPNMSENYKLQLALGMLRSLQRQVQHDLMSAHYHHVLSRRINTGFAGDPQKQVLRDQREDLEVEAKWAANTACEWLRHANILKRAIHHDGIRTQEVSNDAWLLTPKDDLPTWFEDQQRLDTYEASYYATVGDYRNAHRRLNYAQASLVELRLSQGLERAIIELHRADILMLECMRGLQDSDERGDVDEAKTESKPFAIYRDEILKCLHQDYQPTTTFDKYAYEQCMGKLLLLLDSQVRKLSRNEIGRVSSLIEDASQSLDRARPILDRHRKNSWWTSWYFELRMKLMELQLFVALLGDEEIAVQLPFIGAQAAPFPYPTEIDALLDNTRRIVREDAYRFARVVESYANCLFVLGVWRSRVLDVSRLCPGATLLRSTPASDALFRNACELHHREQNMLKWLLQPTPRAGATTLVEGALPVLNRIYERRKKYDETNDDPQPITRAAMSGCLIRYIELVQNHTKKVTQFITSNNQALENLDYSERGDHNH